MFVVFMYFFFFFKQKTAYEMRISDGVQTCALPIYKREPLALDLPERRVVLDDYGKIVSVAVRERLDAHMLIEDYMIAANVAAAKALEAKIGRASCRERVCPYV